MEKYSYASFGLKTRLDLSERQNPTALFSQDYPVYHGHPCSIVLPQNERAIDCVESSQKLWDVVAVQGVSLHVGAGEVVGLL